MTEEQVKYGLKYCIYRGLGGKQGCFQFKLSPAYTVNKGDEGVVWVDAAPTIGQNKYDWNNKITFAMKVDDIGKVLVGFRKGEFGIYHDPDAQTPNRNTRGKRFSLASGQQTGTYFLSLSEKAAGGDKKVSISIGPEEMRILTILLTDAIPKMLYWGKGK